MALPQNLRAGRRDFNRISGAMSRSREYIYFATLPGKTVCWQQHQQLVDEHGQSGDLDGIP
ncbi:MAG: hypothetical protein V7K53_24275 [Nostoc sp.]|uniref:hypothetical protein n=1 Tax=unclassified Nostoc TaxID=2593658 RepID=UPI002AD24567|nr:hypothetical protein [Nostoc sp. ChiQUE01b]MDZ8263905.1 hypothetical protein [Nostoc sp. ChiQUE01b]